MQSNMRASTAYALAGLCIAPSVLINVLPHLARMGDDVGSLGMAAFQAASVVAMVVLPFAVKQLTSGAHKLACYGLGALLLVLNFANALDLATAVRESATNPAKGALQKAATVNTRIADLRNRRLEIPQHDYASESMLYAAQDAVKGASAAVVRECTVATAATVKCRARSRDLADANGALRKIAADRELTERADNIDRDLRTAERELAALGPLPDHIDGTAARIAHVASLLFGNVSDGDVIEWRPIVLAGGIELLAMWGPLGMFAAFGGGVSPMDPGAARMAQESPLRIQGDHQERKPANRPVESPVRPRAARKTKAPAKTVKPRGSSKGAGEIGAVESWLPVRTVPRPGHEVRCGEAFEAYKAWCAEVGRKAVSLKVFGTTLKQRLGVGYVSRSNRGYYVDLALKGGALKVIAA